MLIRVNQNIINDQKQELVFTVEGNIKLYKDLYSDLQTIRRKLFGGELPEEKVLGFKTGETEKNYLREDSYGIFKITNDSMEISDTKIQRCAEIIGNYVKPAITLVLGIKEIAHDCVDKLNGQLKEWKEELHPSKITQEDLDAIDGNDLVMLQYDVEYYKKRLEETQAKLNELEKKCSVADEDIK